MLRNISVEERHKGCSDCEIVKIIDLLLQDPEIVWNDSDMFRSLLLDEYQFVPVIKGQQDWEHSYNTLLPNGIYQKLLVYLIIHIQEYSTRDLKTLRNIFMSLEEEAITGFSYASIYGRAYNRVKRSLESNRMPVEIVIYSNHLANNKLDKGIPLHNTLLVFLINKLLEK